MKLQQLRYIWEVAHHDLNVSATAQSLYTSQPGISKQIKLLEDELGVEVFARSGKHLTRITPAGAMILEKAGEVLRQVESIKQVAQEYSNEKEGTLTIAATHSLARYALPPVVRAFTAKYPDVRLRLQQGGPMQIAELAADGAVAFAIATEGLDMFRDVVALPCFTWSPTLLVPEGHPLAGTNPGLEEIAEYPIVTYSLGHGGRAKLDEAFMHEGIVPNVVFTATDSEVIKTYVRVGTGVGIISEIAYDPSVDTGLVRVNVASVFPHSTAMIGARYSTYVRTYMYDFIEMFAPHLNRSLVEQAFRRHSRSEREALFADVDLPAHAEHSATMVAAGG